MEIVSKLFKNILLTIFLRASINTILCFILFFIRLERKKLVKSFFDLDFRVLISYSQVSTKKKKKIPTIKL